MRHKNDKKVQVNVNGELDALIREAASGMGLSTSALCRLLIVSGLRQRGYTAPTPNPTDPGGGQTTDSNREEPAHGLG